MRRSTSIIGVVLILGSSVASSAHLPPPFANIAEARVAIPEALKTFSKAPTYELLRKLFYQCQCIPENTDSPTWADDRDFKLVAALRLLAIIDALQDPTFDPKHTGASIEAQGPLNSGIMSGEDPADVKDPVLRAEYIAMIKENNARLLYSSLQSDLIRVRREGLAYTSWYIKTRYSQADKNDRLKTLIEKEFSNDTKSNDIVLQLTNTINAK